MFLTLNLILTKRQRFGESNSIECNFIEYVNARKKTNKILKIEHIIFTMIKLI